MPLMEPRQIIDRAAILSPMRAPMFSSCPNCSLVSRSLTRSTPTKQTEPADVPDDLVFFLEFLH